MKFNKIFLLIIMATMASCETIIDLEDPLKGRITLTTDWNTRTEGIDRPANYKVVINSQTLNYTETTNLLPELEAGTYPIYIYNNPENITVGGTTATVATTANIVETLPGWLFTSITEAVYADFKKETITATMTQQVRQLSFELTITGGDPDALQSVTASLSGVANGMDFKANTYTSSGLSVIPVLTRENNKMKGSVRLLGLTTEAKILTLDITYTTGKTQQIITDISNQLSNFNQNKHKSIILTANMEITNQAGFEATINKWQAQESSSGVAW
jgi:hypothetical protein